VSGAMQSTMVSGAVDLGSARESQLLSAVGAGADRHNRQRIEKAANDFESILLGHWLEEAQTSLASAPGGSDDDDADPARFQLQGMGMQALAASITQSGGIGIAALIQRELERSSGDPPVSGGPPGEGLTGKRSLTNERVMVQENSSINP